MAMKQGFSFQRRIADAAEGLGTAGAILVLVVALVYASTRPAARIRWGLTDGHQYGLTAGALWAEALLALERDCQAATPRDWEQLISQFGLTTTRARDLRGTLLEMARDRAWTHLDEAITNLLADGS